MGRALESSHIVSTKQNHTEKAVDSSSILSSANLPVLLFDLTNNVDQAEPITINDKSGNTIATVTREALSCLLRRSESYNEVQESYMQHSRTGVPQIIDVSLPQASYHDSGTPYGHVPPLATHSSQLLPKIPRQSNHHELDFASQPGQSVIQCAPQQPFCQSDEVPPSKSIRKSIRLNNREEIKDLIKSTLNACPQNVLKPILKTAVKFIEPEKQRKWPYVLSEDPVKQTKTIKHRRAVGVDGKLQPPWWPTDIRHREPDHLYKQECVDLGIGLLCYMIDNKGLNHKHGDEAIKKYWKLQVKQLLPALMDSCVSSIGKDTSTDANKRFEARRGERQRKADLWHHGIIQLFQVLFLLSDVKHDRIDATDLIHVEFPPTSVGNLKRKKDPASIEYTLIKSDGKNDDNTDLSVSVCSLDSPKSDRESLMDDDEETNISQQQSSQRIRLTGNKRKASDEDDLAVKALLQQRRLQHNLAMNSSTAATASTITVRELEKCPIDDHSMSCTDQHIFQPDAPPVQPPNAPTHSPQNMSDMSNIYLTPNTGHYQPIYEMSPISPYLPSTNMSMSGMPTSSYMAPAMMQHASPQHQAMMSFLPDTPMHALINQSAPRSTPMDLSMSQEYVPQMNVLSDYSSPSYPSCQSFQSYSAPPMSVCTPPADMKPLNQQSWSCLDSGYSSDSNMASFPPAVTPHTICCSPHP